MPKTNQLAVVTGASSGVGRATARLLAERGFHVLAGVRRSEDGDGIAAERLEPVILDITDSADVRAISERVREDAHSLGALVNNAGIAVNAPVESLPMEGWRLQLEVNFLGQVALTQALLPSLFESEGRVVNVSSIGGRVGPAPTFGAYGASKFALEAMSDALRREVGRLGVRVIVVEPGAVATPIWDKGMATAQELVANMSAEQRARYGDVIEALPGLAAENQRRAIDPADVARVIVGAIEARRPRTRYLVGRDAKLIARVAGVLPDRIVDRLMARALGLGGSRDAHGAAEVRRDAVAAN
jgi:NAD(P)-dependent dehydrogenase (short-subunit alcohol dehydrogenase family)